MFFDKLFNKKVKFIYIYYLIIIFILLIVLFGWSVRHVLLEGTRLKSIENIIINISSIPSNIKKLYKGMDSDLKVNSGKKFKKKGINYSQNELPNSYLLISRYDGDEKRSIVDLVDLVNKKVIHQYYPDIDKINNQIPFDKKKYDSSITHTYYDLSKKKDSSQYWINPNPKKYFDSSVAIPLLIKGHSNLFLEVEK